MKRRSFMQGAAASALIPTAFSARLIQLVSSGIIKPKALNAGDTVGIVAPGSTVTDPIDINKVYEILKHLNLKVKFGTHVLNGKGYKTRTVAERLSDIHEMFADSSIKGIFCIRGGYGSAQLLDKLDYDLISKNPKVFLGFSDITAMHNAIQKQTGLVTFHGPVMLSDFSEYTMLHLQKAIFSTEPIGIISNPASSSGIRDKYPVLTINSGIAKGRLTGGNLSLVTSLIGTPYEIDVKDKILFIEDVGEAPYRIDRMLTHLRLAGKLKAKGIVFGLCAGCDSSNSSTWDYSLGEVLREILSLAEVPAFYGLTFGHTADQLTLPMGVEVEMNADQGTINILESGVV
jgi:muramoyltetrapeptide carboxypeptidase